MESSSGIRWLLRPFRNFLRALVTAWWFRGFWGVCKLFLPLPPLHSLARVGERKEVLEFLLDKSIPGHGEIFTEVLDNKVQPGDILLFPSVKSDSLIPFFIHAAVYCGNGEVIQFQDVHDQWNICAISKEGFGPMKKARGNCQIYRRKHGTDLDEFHRRVTKAMNSEDNYNVGENNCIHFAFYLLDLLDFYPDLVKFQKHVDSRRFGGAT